MNGDKASGDRTTGLKIPGERMNGCNATGDNMIGEKRKGLRINGARIRGDKIVGLNNHGLKINGPRTAGLKTKGDKSTGESTTGCDKALPANINGCSTNGDREIPKRFCLRRDLIVCKPNFSAFAIFLKSFCRAFCNLPSFFLNNFDNLFSATG